MFNKSFSSFIILSELDKLEDLYIEQEEHNEKSLMSWEKFLESSTKGFTDEEKNEFAVWHIDDYLKYSNDYPQLIRKTIFLQTYFSFESYLNNVCDSQKKQLYLNLSYKDMKGQGIERAKLYLCKACGLITDAFSSNEWKTIRDYNTLRNAFVHNNGIVDKSNLKTDPPGLILTKSSPKKDSTLCSIELQRDFLDEVFKTIREFGNKLEGQ
ncbi:hypothetical protein [Bacillus halotolerans]|uniref:hypothetical protein n=1 Tax=Bacillus halotolerans TaxID=260554 RepID=UPI0020C2EC68|nr:hypothetical protein [Bacillus halotolerans]UTL77880.1 hypothetical protein NLW79_06495 [Bacillus halotolerans]WJE44327.1 hypothetical protein QRD86_07120 [Bacillus halotolerans]WPC81878.1 hypothetical protein RA179_06510 [Bacillus halotolerans]